ncbi:hypothetical protein N1851_024744 [Merluccius polli]|uniref:Retrotransposon gag domain-containing protein n=1 Tax=Merluccius polli TaxID=89951 RepID=A0AA47NVC5_MERPO|nr:hypothetical protein N1851_024744 [Merluccius polli]
MSLPMPAPFLPCSGEPSIPFVTWRKMFENYLLAVHATGNAWPEARRRALLIHALGAEGQRLFYTLPDTGTTYGEAMTALERQFVPKVNTVVSRHHFRQRAQRADESVPQYMAALRELAATCAYATMEDEMLRDQLIEKAYVPAVRERLLMEPSLTLDSAITLACQVEHALQSSSVLTVLESITVRERLANQRRESASRISVANQQRVSDSANEVNDDE